MSNYPLNFTNEETLKLRKLANELYSLNEKINRDRFSNKIPEAADTIRALELSDVLLSYVKLDDMDVYFETIADEVS